jgi:aspartate/methionine/tyrosine aminotransferase
MLNHEQPLLSQRAHAQMPSKIREVAELGIGRADILALWFGETQWPTAPNVVSAAISALQQADHYYQPNSGKMALREAIANYHQRTQGLHLPISCVTVTASGMQGIALCAQALITAGDAVIVIEPCWPNIGQSFQAAGAHLIRMGLQTRNQRWHLDIERVIDTIKKNRIRAIAINSPNNPTGWVMPAEQQKLLVEVCRQHGVWIVADDVYSRLVIAGQHAPSFLALAEPEDRIISVNSFSKAWNMTGWRLGWIIAPSELENTLATLTEFNIAGPAGFIQQAGITALEQGEPAIEILNEKLGHAFEFVNEALSRTPKIKFIQPEGAFYCFFGIEGMQDSLKVAKDLLIKQKLGLAPGIAFGAAGEGFLRLCYARDISVLAEAISRLQEYLKGHH